MISVIIKTAFAGGAWQVELPDWATVAAIIRKLLKDPIFKLPEQAANGQAIPYQLLWVEGNTLLNSGQTLRTAGVQSGSTLIIQQEARAGAWPGHSRDDSQGEFPGMIWSAAVTARPPGRRETSSPGHAGPS